MKNPKPHGYDVESKQYDPCCNARRSVTEAGSTFPTELDERAALDNMVESIPVVYGDNVNHISGSEEDI